MDEHLKEILTFLLSRAIPDVSIRSARISRWAWREYLLVVDPHHATFWDRFRMRYPYCRRLAFEHGANRDSVDNCFCPTFPTREHLIDWVLDTLDLPLGERRLLRFYVRCGGC